MDKHDNVYMFYRCDMDKSLAQIWMKILGEESIDKIKVECADGYFTYVNQMLLLSNCHQIKRFFDNNDLPRIDPNEEMIITLPSIVSGKAFNSIVDFFYHGIAKVHIKDLQNFLDAAKFLEVNGLKDIEIAFENQSDDQDDKFTKLKQEEISPIENQRFIFPSAGSSGDWIRKKCPSLLSSNQLRPRMQGRRPQPGSPLITEEFKFGDRYLCKVCQRGYLWKKSLVRHYKDFHPDKVELVTEETQF